METDDIHNVLMTRIAEWRLTTFEQRVDDEDRRMETDDIHNNVLMMRIAEWRLTTFTTC